MRLHSHITDLGQLSRVLGNCRRYDLPIAPDDGDALAETLEQAEEMTGVRPWRAQLRNMSCSTLPRWNRMSGGSKKHLELDNSSSLGIKACHLEL